MALVEVQDLRICIPRQGRDFAAVESVSFDIEPGECFGLVGESGSGKSVTAMSLVGLGPANSRIAGGAARVAGLDIGSASSRQLRALLRNDVGLIFQNPMTALNPRLSVGQQLIEAQGASFHRPSPLALSRALTLLEDTGIRDPEARLPQFPHELSGGLAQRVVIAMALAREPKLLIADEPTTALDARVQAQILDLIDELRRSRGLALLLVSHDLGVIADRSDRLAVMRAGRFLESGPTRQIVARPKAEYTKALLRVVPRLPHHAIPQFVELERSSTGTEELAVLEEPLPFPAAGGPRLVTATELTKDFRVRTPRGHVTRRALDGVSFELRQGDSLGIVGESGSGKTTLARIAVGLETASSGAVAMSDLSRRSGSSEVQYVFQDSSGSLDPNMRVRDLIAEFLEKRIRSRRARYLRVEELLAEVELDESFLMRFPRQMSGGQRQRINIARALAAEPKLLVADEPVSALDVSVQATVINLLNRLRVSHGMSYIVISHDLGVVRYLCNRVMVLRDGAVQESGAVDHLIENPQSEYAMRLVQSVPGARAL